MIDVDVEKVKYIQSVFGLDSNPILLLDLAEIIQTIDFESFRQWLKRNMNHYDARFEKKYEKFLVLIGLFRNEYEREKNEGRLIIAESEAERISRKVRVVASGVMNEYDFKGIELHFKNFYTAEKEPFFASWEQKQLEKIGSLLQCVLLQRSVSGVDALAKKLSNNMQNLVLDTPKIENRNKATKMLANSFQKVDGIG